MGALTIGIAGAGVLGRLLAWRLSRAGHAVTVFDPAPGPHAPAPGSLHTPVVPHAAGFTAAGMLSPLAELDNAGPEVARLGWRSLTLWREVAAALEPESAGHPLFAQQGSLMVAHGSDTGAAQRVLARLHAASTPADNWPVPRALNRDELTTLEPALAPGLRAWLLPQEAQLLPREMLVALATRSDNVWWCWGESAVRVEPGVIHLAGEPAQHFDLAIDTRGVGARGALGGEAAAVRGVRGEVIWLHAPELQLQRPVRLLHPRHRVYIVPRPGDMVMIGATEIESEDRSPVSLRSAVELMSAAHSVLPPLAEARIVHMESNLRPALPDNAPHTHAEPGLLRINGLFRHGWLLAPALVQDALQSLNLEATHV
ncbi:FAD-dependent oxidoreductase [Hydrogenophaga sp. PAMC20947]|uniref:FAD-dependent oxidoreductase n=1 Tax=Hydrogenophaga sp. PAMC20947 TaxID=2565558 RepID=UPI00109E0020|nr:FAD-dependent oxidoreductase [Hydrogenophaga sp. PAMC20947]QCB44623.1 FAD-dependent oxidoreductase [Hydrogenophaga sp. PAMC20947]